MTMQGFDEYATLARHLHQLQRTGERTTAQAAARRDATGDTIDQLGQRLTMQEQRLVELAKLIGEPVPQLSAPLPPLTVAGHLGSPASRHQGAEQELAGGSAYPELPVGPDRVALTSTPASAPAVPGPRLPSAGEDGPPTRHLSSPAAPVNPDVELDLAHRAAAAADEAAAQVEELAQQPALLPGSSPFSRAIVVYVGFIAAGNLAQALLALVAKAGAVDGFTLYAWMLAGLPALTFFAAYFALGAWGRARIGGGRPARYARLGFAMCFVIMSITSCFWTVLLDV
ncbi:hypothetical protein [Micromonospora sp. NBC_01796]|uniref:hypothetical protein n=1 Tax=Micromonospora sp. NBC_01796 TaxID=2975987 RepID=UPI002DD96E66|nr:hypothetical protein [Micromonospora sp. NBC_01796]WSA83499.1 hypothetical protein OIE47_24270 [Micromonospora sp. NBC_01796]